MNNQQKYLITGTSAALLIVLLVKTVATYGLDSNAYLLLIAAISATMMYLVFNIFIITQTLVPAKNVAGNGRDNKLR